MTPPDRDMIAAEIRDLTRPDGYLDRVRDLLAEPATHRIGESQHVRHEVIGSPAPWNDEAAGLLFEVHAGARRHEAVLRIALGHLRRARGNSDGATLIALATLPDLIAAAHPTHPTPAEKAAADVRRWCRLARQVLDDDMREDDRHRQTTKAPGIKCPYCQRPMVLRHGWQYDEKPAVWCLRCPSTITEESPKPTDLMYEASAWLGMVLQHDTEGETA